MKKLESERGKIRGRKAVRNKGFEEERKEERTDTHDEEKRRNTWKITKQ